MGRPIDHYDEIAIAEIVLYVFLLGGAIFLSIKHGFSRSAGWRFLIVLALARLIGSAMLLASISDPTNESLYIGWMTLNGFGLGPLILLLLGLLGRLFDSINRQGHVLIKPIFNQMISLLMLVGLILIIVGGTQSNYSIINGQPKVDYSTISRAGLALIIVVMVLLIFEIGLLFVNQGYIAQGEHRILLIVVVCLPFVIVRLAYSCILVLGEVSTSPWLYLGLSVLMELIVAFACEGLGFTLEKAPPMPKAGTSRDSERQDQVRQ